EGYPWCRQGSVGVDLERAHQARYADGSCQGIRSTATRGRYPLPMIEAEASSALSVWHPGSALNRPECTARAIEAAAVPLERVAQAKLHRSIEQLIGHSQKAAGGSEKIVLPAQEVVGLSGQ